jgi:hypothetical protein
VKEIENADFDVICLDHDFGGAYLDCSSNCGHGLSTAISARWGCLSGGPRNQQEELPPSVVIVHSWNPDAAKSMEAFLKESNLPKTTILRVPFGSFRFEGRTISTK